MVEAENPGRSGTSRATDMVVSRGRSARAANQIHAALRADIVEMRLKPLDILNEKHLGERFGVSRTPVREALLRLSDEGLVDIYPQSGTFVALIPRRALFEAILIRKALEATTVTLAIAGDTPGGLAELEEKQAQLIVSAEQGDILAFHRIDSEFHQHIAELAGYPGIWNVIRQVQVQIDRYRYITLPRSGRLDVVIEEHAAIIDGMRRRDDCAAVAAMEIHIGRMIEELEDIQYLDPTIFIDDRQS
jgi:DNA-binding GntR family transcriptional regulator